MDEVRNLHRSDTDSARQRRLGEIELIQQLSKKSTGVNGGKAVLRRRFTSPVIVHNLDFQCITTLKVKAHSPLVIHHKEVREFDNLFADYLKAKGEAIRGPEIDSDEEGEKLFELSWNLFWKLVQTPAPQRRQIDDKFQALFFRNVGWRDQPHREGHAGKHPL